MPSKRAIENCRKKRAYLCKKFAKEMVKRAMAKHGGGKQKVYQCDVCGAWHLTKPRKTKPKTN